MHQDQIIYELNGKKYLLVEVFVPNEAALNEIKSESAKYNAIYQGIKEIKKSFWSSHAILKVLVPEENVSDFCKLV